MAKIRANIIKIRLEKPRIVKGYNFSETVNRHYEKTLGKGLLVGILGITYPATTIISV